MTLALGFALYFMIWWLVLFAVLPFGVVTQDETADVVPGKPGCAPHAVQLAKGLPRQYRGCYPCVRTGLDGASSELARHDTADGRCSSGIANGAAQARLTVALAALSHEVRTCVPGGCGTR